MARRQLQGLEAMQGAKKRLLSRDDIENEFGLSRRWLELAALRGDGPPMRKISARMVRYERAEFESWLEARRVISTSDTGA
jgi:predicted DNA-binding transcriptional regulator AlpA